jgi:hypothetical protein
VPRTLVAVLGMHRSGTSATAGTIQQYGFEVGPVSGQNRSNLRGNRELRGLVKLHDRILKRSGGSWWQPPEEVSIAEDDCRQRDEVLAMIPGEQVAVKDPRMLLVLGLWRDLEPRWIGVIRNPVAVRSSLERRVRERGRPGLDGAGWEALWRRYNRILLAELERSPFPVIDFDRPDDLDGQVRGALAFYGLDVVAGRTFFDPELVRERVDPAWREQVHSPESVELWERLAVHAGVPA